MSRTVVSVVSGGTLAAQIFKNQCVNQESQHQRMCSCCIHPLLSAALSSHMCGLQSQGPLKEPSSSLFKSSGLDEVHDYDFQTRGRPTHSGIGVLT